MLYSTLAVGTTSAGKNSQSLDGVPQGAELSFLAYFPACVFASLFTYFFASLFTYLFAYLLTHALAYPLAYFLAY